MERSSKAKLKAIPKPPATTDAATRQFFAAMVESLETLSGQRGNNLDRAVTRRELAGGNGDLYRMVNGQLVPAGDLVKPPRTTTPEPVKLPPPTSFVASGAFENIIMHWTYPDELVEYVAYYEIYRSTTDDIADAALVLRPGFKVATDTVGEGNTFYYWVRAVSASNTASDFNAVEGTSATTALSAETILEKLEGQISETELNEELTTAVENGSAVATMWSEVSTVGDLTGGFGLFNNGDKVDFAISATNFWIYDPTAEVGAYPLIVEEGKVYMNTAVIQNASIDVAKIKALTVDDISAANGFYASLKAGFLSIDQGVIGTSLKSENYSTTAGWKLEKNGQWHLNNGTIEIRDDSGRLRVKIGKL